MSVLKSKFYMVTLSILVNLKASVYNNDNGRPSFDEVIEPVISIL